MNKKIATLGVVLLFAITTTLYVLLKNRTQNSVPVYPNHRNYQIKQIHEFKRDELSQGTYNTEGYVVKIYACPTGSFCKPCMENNVIVSETNVVKDSYNLSDKEVVIFTKDVTNLKLGKKYFLSVRITERRSTNDPINDIELISYGLIE